MRLARFDGTRLGLVEGEEIIDVGAALGALPTQRWPLAPGDPLIAHLDALAPAIRKAAETGARHALDAVALNSPVANPTKIIAAPVNYAKHLDESRADTGINFGGEVKTIADYGVFLKNPTALVGAAEGVEVIWPDRRIDHEVELAAVIGKPGRSIAKDKAMDHVAGYAIGLDMTVRGTEDRSFRKSLDTFAVLGPWLVTADEVPDPGRLDFALTVNGEPRQASNTALLIWDIPTLIAYASEAYTLYPGDIVMTGTPEGVGPVVAGDVMHCRIEGIGEMTVPVRARD